MTITNLTKVVILDDDPANNMIGTVLANTFYQGERHYIVKLDFQFCGYLGHRRALDQDGWEHEFEETTIEVTEMVVPEHMVQLAPFYANIYEASTRCISPAEGGCYVTDYEHVAYFGPFDTQAEALAAGEHALLGDWKPCGTASSVVYSGGDYSFRVEHKPGSDEPSPINHYS